jgi:hypothetical protein
MEEGGSSGSAARAFTAKKNKKASGSLSDRPKPDCVGDVVIIIIIVIIFVVVIIISSSFTVRADIQGGQ